MRYRLLAVAIALSTPWFSVPAAAKPAGAAATGEAKAAGSKAAGSKAAGSKAAGSKAPEASSSSAKPPPAKTNSKAAPKKLASKAKRREPPPCFAKPVRFTRQRGTELEQRTFSLSFCDGRPNPQALEELSLIARPREVDAPSTNELRAYASRALDRGPKSKRRDPMFMSERVMRLHPDLLGRLQKIADRFPGRTIDIVSGHRPEARSTSRHHHGRALDLRVEGISRERLRDFARSLEATGVGYYPNSVFVHVDVREDKGYWVDRSGPGEPADYGAWPPAPREQEDARQRVLTGALADLSALGDLSMLHPRDDEERAPLHLRSEPMKVPALTEHAAPRERPVATPRRSPAGESEGSRPLTADEVKRIRADALKALAALR